MLNDDQYLLNLGIRLREGTAHPAIEKLFWEVAANIVKKVELVDSKNRPITGDVTDPVQRAKILLSKAAELTGANAAEAAEQLLKSIREQGKVH